MIFRKHTDFMPKQIAQPNHHVLSAEIIKFAPDGQRFNEAKNKLDQSDFLL